MDQAEGLRSIKESMQDDKVSVKPCAELNIVAITGGKGGVGKSNISLNLAIALKRIGKRVCLLDADFGLSNIDVLLGIKPKFNIGHVFSGQKKLSEIIVDGPNNIKIIPAASGLKHLAELDQETLNIFINNARLLGDEFDYLIIDTPAGISKNVMTFLLGATCIIVIATPEPTSITDSYALLKSYRLEGGKTNPMILMNMCRTEDEGIKIGNRLRQICSHFMGILPELAGVIIYDQKVVQAIRHQKSFIEMFPSASPSREILKIAEKLVNWDLNKNDMGDFFHSIRNLLS